MATKRHDLFRTALELDETERAELAALLLESLEADSDTGVDAAWRIEVERRMKELDSGDVETVPWAEVRKRLFQGLDA
jgi:putative addiction module component (TIGR02574 family)